MRFLLTKGQTQDSPLAQSLVEGFQSDALLADRAYDSDRFLQWLTRQDCQVVIPPRKNRLNPHEYDKFLYRERHLVKFFINKMKHFRRVFSQFEKYAKLYLNFLFFVTTIIWLR